MARLRETHERELKLAVPPGFALPDLPGEKLEPKTFTSTYHDTADRALARAGITLRRRVQESARPLAAEAARRGRAARARAPGGPRRAARRARRLCSSGVLRGRALEPAAVLRTRREGVRARENGRAVADVTVDTVSRARRTPRAGALRRARGRSSRRAGADALPGLGADAPRSGSGGRATGGRRPSGRWASSRSSRRLRPAGRRRSSTCGR